MKRAIHTILLSFLCLVSYAQENNKVIEIIAIINYSDSTLFREKYEIDLKDKKIFYITAVSNYLDIKNVKYKTQIKIDKSNWTRIIKLINNINFNRLEIVKDRSLEKSMYEIEISNSKENTIITYSVLDETELNNLKRIFNIIRRNITVANSRSYAIAGPCGCYCLLTWLNSG